MVTHLSLKIEDTSEDDIIFVTEWQVSPAEVSEPGSKEQLRLDYFISRCSFFKFILFRRIQNSLFRSDGKENSLQFRFGLIKG